MLITCVASIACAVAKGYGVQVFTRMLQGFCASGAFGVGAGSIADCFFLHERSFYNGAWIAVAQSGSFVWPMITGAVIQANGWRWSLWLMAIVSGGILLSMFLFLPETLLKRKHLFAQPSFGRISPQPMSLLEFFRPLYVLKYPSVGLVALSWFLGVSMPDIGISNIVPLAYGDVYGWGPRVQDLSNTGFLIGCILEEICAGKVSVMYIRWHLKRNGGIFVPEMRLHPMIPGLIMMPFGLAGFSSCVQHHTHWMGPVSMMAITIFGY
ncbi:MAG: hypothetical protein FE78DRAFT_159098 [Acidomyces sp. 'richmondensis']|nr:MAG: hypothetical protein FE78DRAFT_159098 [Acidomyces sp. 'richmondensis']